ncbi:MAG TPA: hypothetical protein VGI87_02260 [Solirubrobacteraceae bacterium]
MEIERAEQEALGPVRRSPEEVEQPPLAPHAEGHEYVDYETDEHAASEDEFTSEEPRAGQPFDHAEALDHAGAVDHPEDEPLDHPEERGGFDHVGQETAEYDVERQHAGERDEDVLEETPEFLQDTPEHDRLWFEQRPPRDFDFDE